MININDILESKRLIVDLQIKISSHINSNDRIRPISPDFLKNINDVLIILCESQGDIFNNKCEDIRLRLIKIYTWCLSEKIYIKKKWIDTTENLGSDYYVHDKVEQTISDLESELSFLDIFRKILYPIACNE